MEVLNRVEAIAILNRIMECELSGVVRYTHYSLMVCGDNRDPVVGWLRAQADEGLKHAQRAGKLLTLLGGHPTLGIRPLQDSYEQDITAILHESLDHEYEACAAYRDLLCLCQGRSVFIEDYARQLIVAEELHTEQVITLLQTPHDVTPYAA